MNNISENENKGLNSLYLSLADKNVELRYHFIRGFLNCKNYISNSGKPDIIVSVSEDEIRDAFNGMCGKKWLIKSLDDNTEYGDLESALIYTKIANAMLDYNILLMHGAAIAVNNKCYIFTAPSGTGKTTHILNWLKVIPNTIVVNGDKPLIDVEKKLVYGTPWCGKEGMNTNTSVPLAGIIYLERGDDNRITPISFKEMLPTYLQQVYVPHSQVLALKAYELIGRLKDIPCYRLSCNMQEDSARVAYRGLCEL